MTKYLPIQRIALIRESNLKPWGKVASSDDAQKVMADYYGSRQFAQEVFAVVTLDTKNQITGIVEVTRGTLDASLVHPREVFAPAIAATASSIILAHNHPSGDPTPSREDISVTQRLTECGTLLGIDVLDHIIVGDHTGKTVSIREVR